MEYTSINNYLKNEYGYKLYKLSLNSGLTCPNRDGKISTKGCIFCSNGGSGDFAAPSSKSIIEQIEFSKEKISKKFKKDVLNSNPQYIAYFQAFTNTYGPISYLRKIFYEAINHPDIAILSIATRPDCLGKDILLLLNELNHIKPVWIELGLQTIHQNTANFINRGYELNVYNQAIKNLNSINVKIITHIILGLPNETKEMMLESVRYVTNMNIFGIKLQLLHILKNTKLEEYYNQGIIKELSFEEYLDIIKSCIDIIPSNITIHRLTGDGPKNDLIAPKWSGNKKMVLNAINNL